MGRNVRTGPDARHDQLSWAQTDLYSLLDAERALAGADVAIYLVHSMLPSGRLSQGTFRDYDTILADNFARAAHRRKVKQIIYLGGLIPSDCDKLSPHLESRLEVEKTLRQYPTPVTTLRAGLVVGTGGSSFTILMRLITRLPLLICPQWTQTRCQPIDVQDVVTCLMYAVDHLADHHRIYDIGGDDTMTYYEMLQTTAAAKDKIRFFTRVPFLSPGLSKYWVCLITGAPKTLVYPLVQSLRHNMEVDPKRRLQPPGHHFKSFSQSLQDAIAFRESGESKTTAVTAPKPHAFEMGAKQKAQKDVQSVQRLPLPPGKNAQWVAQIYMKWLPKFLPWLIRVKVEGPTCFFHLVLLPAPLLILRLSEERSSPDRQLFYIKGGMLAGIQDRGRLEFREIADRSAIIAAIHDFRPSLPWFIYRYSQALFHLLVMRCFGRYLNRVARKIGQHKPQQLAPSS